MSIREYRDASMNSKSPKLTNIFSRRERNDKSAEKSNNSRSRSFTRSNVPGVDPRSSIGDNLSDFAQNLNTHLLPYKKFEELAKKVIKINNFQKSKFCKLISIPSLYKKCLLTVMPQVAKEHSNIEAMVNKFIFEQYTEQIENYQYKFNDQKSDHSSKVFEKTSDEEAKKSCGPLPQGK